ncbi:MAG: EF-P lysine aminoacylase GenX [Gammaproteobacteria bacterium]|nr:EF-P lysine aminoacylase GenX [Gammaproteobacteria bacterium]
MPHNWRPTASPETLRLRARLLARIRAFFAARDVLEVETPALCQTAVTDPQLASFLVPAPDRDRYLRTSPEFAMKRLLAAGYGDIYEIAKVFREGEAGRYHNPEFSLIEWYRLGFDHHALMDEVEALLGRALDNLCPMTPARRVTYRDAFAEHSGLDSATVSIAACRASLAARGIEMHTELDRRGWLELLMSHVIVPECSRDGFTFIYDFPEDQAALATVRPGAPSVASRFELLAYGVELANGFHELTDPCEQRARFERELASRRESVAPIVPLDENLLAALAHGLPACAGVAVGLDRLVMLAAGHDHIVQAMAFSWDTA